MPPMPVPRKTPVRAGIGADRTGLLERFGARRHGELREPVGAPSFLRVVEERQGIEPLDTEAVRGWTRQEPVPVGVASDTAVRDDAEARDGDPAWHQSLAVIRSKA